MIAILGYHSELPPMDGGSIRSLELHKFLGGSMPHHFYARNAVLDSSDALVVGYKSGANSKLLASLRCLMFRSHYVRERHLSSEGKDEFVARVLDYDATFANFIWSADVADFNVNYLDTHNSEEEWFNNVARSSRSLLIKLICRVSLNYSLSVLRKLPSSVNFVHVCEEDRAYYRKLRPDCNHLLVPNGCNVYPRHMTCNQRNESSPVKLYFLGSLSVSMNYDALLYFSRVFWPRLRAVSRFDVFGSRPPGKVVQLCADNGWGLFANLGDQALQKELVDYDVAVMPFERSAGSKLKFLDALARGKWVLGTSVAGKGVIGLPQTVCLSDSPNDWFLFLTSLSKQRTRGSLLSSEFASNYSWPAVYRRFLLEDRGPMGARWRTINGF